VDLSISEAKDLLGVLVLVLVKAEVLALLGNFSLKSSEISFIVNLHSDIRLGHASSFVGSDSEVPSPVVMGFVLVFSVAFLVRSYLFLMNRVHREN